MSAEQASRTGEPPTSPAALRALRLESAVTALLNRGPLSRTELAQLTGYSPSSMTSTIRELMTTGQVREVGPAASTGGRRRTLLQFDRTTVLVTLVSIEAPYVTVTQVDLEGQTQVQIRRRLDPSEPLQSITEALTALHTAAVSSSQCIIVSLPGVVSAEGDVSLAPSLGAAAGSHLDDVLAEATGLPVLVENDVNLLALGEHASGSARGAADYVLVFVGEGIGGGLVLDGRIRRGANQSAGELGFLPWAGLAPTAGSTVGPLESAWSVPALETRAAELGLDPGDRGVVAALSEAALSEAAPPEAAPSEAGASPAQALLDRAVEAWAYAAVATSCVVDPSLVVFAGAATDLDQARRDHLAATVTDQSPSPVDVRFAELGDSAIVHGAIAHLVAHPQLIITAPPGASQ